MRELEEAKQEAEIDQQKKGTAHSEEVAELRSQMQQESVKAKESLEKVQEECAALQAKVSLNDEVTHELRVQVEDLRKEAARSQEELLLARTSLDAKEVCVCMFLSLSLCSCMYFFVLFILFYFI